VIFHILTLFPQTFDSVFSQSILKRAQEKNLLKINLINIRDFATDKHKTVDDKPYGGGVGMVLKVDIVLKALRSIRTKPYTILLSANGKKFDQKKAQILSKKKNIAIICGHYEGIDARVEKYVDETLSIGDYILTGGEIPAMAVVDAVARQIKAVLGKEESLEEKRYGAGVPAYTKPEAFKYKGKEYRVPKVLLSGNHKEIDEWRKKNSKGLNN